MKDIYNGYYNLFSIIFILLFNEKNYIIFIEWSIN